MWINFDSIDTKKEVKYDAKVDPQEHIHRCTSVWKEIPKQEWVHGFIHTLEMIPMNWYLETEPRHGTTNLTNLVEGFMPTFSFEDDFPSIDSTHQVIRAKFFENEASLTWEHDWVV